MTHVTPPDPDPVRVLFEDFLCGAFVLINLFEELLDEIPPDAFPGEDPGAVLLEMMVGSARPAADAAGPEAVRSATALLGAFVDRVFDDFAEARRRTHR